VAITYETPTALSQFSFVQFKTTMSVSDIDEPTFALILRSIFANLLVQYDIDIDTVTEMTYDFSFAIFRHAKFIFEVQKQNLDVIQKTSDASGNRTTFKVQTPKDVISVYKMYSPILPALL